MKAKHFIWRPALVLLLFMIVISTTCLTGCGYFFSRPNEAAQIENASSGQEVQDKSAGSALKGRQAAQEPEAPATETYCVKAMSGLRLRAAANTQADVVSHMPYKSVVEVYEIQNGWAHARFGEFEGYCSADYLLPGDGSDFTDMALWKAAYLNYVNRVVGDASYGYYQEDYVSFDLTYVDGDDVPEMVLIGSYEAIGEMLCTYHNGRVETLPLGRLGGTSYIPGTGLIYHKNGNMGCYPCEVYKLAGGSFKTLLEGLEDYNDEYGNYSDYARYFVGGNRVSETEFNNRFAAIYDFSKSVPMEGSMNLSQLRSKLS